MRRKRFGDVLRFVIIFAAYFITAKIGLTLNSVSGFATLIWAPTGISLAALLIFGYKYWPSITLAAILINLQTGAPLLVAAGIGIGNTLEALTGAYLINRISGFRHSLERVKDIFGLVILAALFSTIVSATIGVTSLWLGGTVASEAIISTWLTWWVGDMLGALVVAPLLLVWSRRLKYKFRPRRLAEAIIYMAILIGVSILVFRGSTWIGLRPFTLAFTIFPLLIWIALRFGQIGSVTAIFVTSLIAIWGTIASFNSGSGSDLSHRLLLLQSFMGISSITFMTMAAVVAEREFNQIRRSQLMQRANLLTKQRARLMILNQAKDEFITLASHQLRTPATSVKQYSKMMLENYVGKLSKEQSKMLNVIYESNERQLQVIDSLLRVAQIDAGNIALKKEKVDLVPFITEILHGQLPVFETRHQTVDFRPGNKKFVASIDKARIKMVIENIIDNASKYSQDGKKVEVKLKQTKSHVAISVKDAGVGIVKKDRAKLFKKFSRINNQFSTTVGGTGLGLYLSKKIIDLHLGSIDVTSRLKRGSTFTINLPNGRH